MPLDKLTAEMTRTIDIVHSGFGVITHVELSYKYPAPSAPSVKDPNWSFEGFRPLRAAPSIELNFGETDFCDKDPCPIILDCPGLPCWGAKAS